MKQRLAKKISPVAAPMENTGSERRTPAREGCAIFLLLGLISILLISILILPVFRQTTPWLPIAMHSILHADYSADQHPNSVPPALLGLIGDMLLDDNPSQAPERLSTVISALESPVVTVTPYPGETLLPTATATPLPPTVTLSEPLLTPTWTPKPSATNPAPSLTPLTPTSTIWETLPPTWIPSPTHAPATKTPTSESTGKPPTQPAVTVPGPTPTKRPTSTNPPPTNTPEPTNPPPTKPPPTEPPPTEPPAPTPYPPPPKPTSPPPTQPPYPGPG
jgi:hypothetical protein